MVEVSPIVIYPELSYRIIGIAFQVFNDNGYEMTEKYYQRAFARALEAEGIPFTKEKMVNVAYRNQPIARYFLDLVIDNKIVVELKVRPRLGYVHVKQVLNYLKHSGYRLAIIIYFTRNGVKYRRIINAA